MLKIATIGGGSSYTPELIEGFIKRYDELPIDELWLVDIEDGYEKLEIVGNLAKRMVEKANIPMKIYLTLDRKKALEGASFVTTQFRVGGLDKREIDEKIPIQNGMIGQETNGIGGFFKALRTVPVIDDIIKDIKKYCNGAWLINFTNPAGMITEAAINRFDYPKTIGLCNVPLSLLESISKMLNVDENRLVLELTGLNHHSFVTDVKLDGESVIDEVIEKYVNLNNDERANMKNIISIPFTNEFIRGIKAIPSPYINYYVNLREQLNEEKESFKTGTVRAEVVKKVEKELFEVYKDVNLKEKPKQLELRGGARYSDAACNLITSIYTNKKDIQYVNCLNNGAIKGLDDNYVIETAAIITNEGPIPVHSGNMPYILKGTIESIKTFELAAVDSAITGDENLAIAALSFNRLVDSSIECVKIFNEMKEKNKGYINIK